ncbi:MAG: UbiH/UbiF/VisC/COQ6 family ubiquinone biosynthesis hydroxylase [Alphaproteobacteria bacterium]|nr:UbiH/UbiF/VisC/COQ6 family ubiquinone biosynthesis hydroxylase [Alphaproteobacteria bacterium]MDE2335857.1 UbiH/UbiF/VisC/COQ6 family ubiquinone biosynthesis hydroxylase [Alphaproteobacteria bacterium]
MPRPAHIRTSVLIVGGGLSGLALAGALGEAGIDCLCIDRAPPAAQLAEQYDGRTTAISYASHLVLKSAGAWEALLPDCEPINDIRVADGNSPFYLHFDCDGDGGGNPFGWIVENRILRHQLFKNAGRLEKHVRHIAPAEIRNFSSGKASAGVILKDGTKITAPLMIGADGRNSSVRQWLGIDVKTFDYKQSAIVCNVAHKLDHENAAVEHFRPAGPFAVLPMTDSAEGEHRSSVVWTEHGGDVQDILSLSTEDFDARLQDLFGPHLGKVRHVSKPMSYPLSLMHAERYTGTRVALMAEAAHAIHPIAGQGLNLSLRDVAVLTELIVTHLRHGLDIGAATLLQQYETARRGDTLLMAGVTDILNRLFSNDRPAVRLMRGLGLGIVQKIPPLKRYFARQAMGISGIMPDSLRKA